MKKFIIAVLALMLCISWAAPETFGQSRKELIKLAKKGDAEAQYKLGYCYYFGYDGYGTGMEKAKEDLKQAEKWLLEAADNGEKRAYSMLGHIYVKYKNYPEAIKWYRMDADAGNQYSYGDLAEAYKKTGNYTEAAKWYKKSADRNSRPSSTIRYFMDAGNHEMEKKTYFLSFEDMQEWAAKGNSQAQCMLAYHYFIEGIIANIKTRSTDFIETDDGDYANAEKWYLEAAGNFDIGAYFPLGVLYQYVLKNPEQAVRWYKKAADAGNETALVCLTDLGENYTPVPLSEDSIEMLLQKASDGDGQAQYRLASCYMFGSTVYDGEQNVFTPDYAKAEKWFIEAGENGKAADAWSTLGLMYSFRVINDSKAVYWYKKAVKAGDELSIDMLESYGVYYSEDGRDRLLEKAEAGDGEAQYELASCYNHGKKSYNGDLGELPYDYENAEKWYLIAARNGKERNAWFALGLMYDSMGKTDKAISALDLASLYGSDLAAERLDEIKNRSGRSSSSRASSSSSRSSSTSGGLIAEGTYTISSQGWSQTTGMATGVAGPDYTVKVGFYDDHITVDGFIYKYSGMESGWKKYTGNEISFGNMSSITFYYVDSWYNMRKVDRSTASFGMMGGMTDWFTYRMEKGKVVIPDAPSGYGNGSGYGSGSSGSTSGSYSTHECSLCHGTGRIVRETPTSTYGTGDYQVK